MRIVQNKLIALLIVVLFGTYVVPLHAEANSDGSSAGVERTNLIRNGNFSLLADTDRPAEWEFNINGEEYQVFAEADGFDGLPAIRLEGSDENGHIIVNQRNIPAEEYRNQTLKVSAWYKGTNVTMRANANNFFRVEFWKSTEDGLKSAGSTIFLHAPEGTTDWINLQREFRVPSETDVIWVSSYYRNSSGTIRWSGLELHPLKDEGGLLPDEDVDGDSSDNPNLILNGDFTQMIGENRWAHWGFDIRPQSDYRIHVEEDGFHGRPALRLEGSMTDDRILIVQRDIPAQSYQNKRLKASAWYKGTDVNMRSEAVNFFRVEFFKSTEDGLKATASQLRIHAPDGSTDDWILVEQEFDVPSDTDVFWISLFFRNATGSVRWAGLELKEVRNDAVDRQPGVFYVSPDGHDNQAGTKTDPWATLGKASREARPGDTVILLPGTYEGSNNLLVPRYSGRPDSPITFRAEERRTARLAGTPGADHAILLDGVSHIRLEGLHVLPNSHRGRWFLAQKTKDIHLTDMFFDRPRGEDLAVGTPFLVVDSEEVFVRDSVIRRGGFNMAVIQRSQRILFEGNAISYAGHAPLQFYDPTQQHYETDVVIRGNVLHPTWGRALELHMAQHVLLENNIIIHSLHGGRSASEASQPNVFQGIYRFNRLFRNWGTPIQMQPWLDTHGFIDSRIYNNVFDHNNLDGLRVGQGSVSSPVRNNVVKNNIFYRNDPHGEQRQVTLGQGAEHVRFFNNVVGDTGKVAVYNFSPQKPEFFESEQWQRVYGDNQFRDNFQSPIGFVNPETYDHRLLQTSPLRDAGAPLTYASRDGDGHVLPVDDVHYFYDGFGIPGERGDLIAVGDATQVARVTGVDREAGTLQLDRALVWKEGDAVSLAWSGAAPDMGPIEHGETGRVSVFVEVDSFFVESGQPVTLRAHVYGSIQPVAYEWRLGDGTLAHGQEISHVYEFPQDQFFSPNGFPIRVRVTDKDGFSYVGVGFVEQAPPHDRQLPLMHTTFNQDDADWWWILYKSRPTPVDWDQELDPATGEGVFRVSNPGRGSLPLHINPAQWEIDDYPFVYLRYRITPGTPVGLYLRAFDAATGVERRVNVAAASSVTGVPTVYRLIDDGEWHALLFDARIIRESYPDVAVIRRLGFEALSPSNEGDTYWLDEAAILPVEAGQVPYWRDLLHNVQKGHVDITSPSDGRVARGEVPIQFRIQPYRGMDGKQLLRCVRHVEITLNGELLVSTDNLNEARAASINADPLHDGEHTLAIQITDETGEQLSHSISFTVRNWETMIDSSVAPRQVALLGSTITVGDEKTTDQSPGWTYVEHMDHPLVKENGGRVKTTDNEEYLEWKAPGLRTFSVTVYSEVQDLAPIVKVAANVGADHWVELPFSVDVLERPKAGVTKYELRGAGPEHGVAQSFRITVGPEIRAGQLQLHEVALETRAGGQ